jgi:hypothetical protein
MLTYLNNIKLIREAMATSLTFTEKNQNLTKNYKDSCKLPDIALG